MPNFSRIERLLSNFYELLDSQNDCVAKKKLGIEKKHRKVTKQPEIMQHAVLKYHFDYERVLRLIFFIN